MTTTNEKVDVTAIRIKLFALKEIAGGGNSEITLQFTEGAKITFTELEKEFCKLIQSYHRSYLYLQLIIK